jgi:uncharacterized membrane protein YphA (DoxX/SURF4 family)
MRVLLGLLVAGFLILVGVFPPIAEFVGSLLWAVLGLGVHGAALLLAQTAVKAVVIVTGGVWLYRTRRIA